MKSKLGLLAICLLLASCCPKNGQDGAAGSDGHSALVSQSPATVAQCLMGGFQVKFGIDKNDDGTLESNEVTSTNVLCNGLTGATGSNGNDGHDGLNGNDGHDGSNGHVALVIQTPATIGQCPTGGVVIQSGLDSNNNFILDSIEISQSSVVCNGLVGQTGQNGNDGSNGHDGSNGNNGSNSLINTTAAASNLCPNGGSVITSGLDVNQDSILENSEVTSTAVVCNGVNGTTPAYSVTSTIAPCGVNSSPYKEQLLCLNNGSVLASFSDNANGLNTRFALIPAGSYIDTDQSSCHFNVSVSGDGSTTVSWSAGSNQFSSWATQSVTCVAH